MLKSFYTLFFLVFSFFCYVFFLIETVVLLKNNFVFCDSPVLTSFTFNSWFNSSTIIGNVFYSEFLLLFFSLFLLVYNRPLLSISFLSKNQIGQTSNPMNFKEYFFIFLNSENKKLFILQFILFPLVLWHELKKIIFFLSQDLQFSISIFDFLFIEDGLSSFFKLLI